MTNENPKISAIGLKDGFEIEVSFTAIKGEFSFPDISGNAANDQKDDWARILLGMMLDPTLYSVVPKIPPFGSVERAETVLRSFFNSTEDLQIQYQNCQPAPIDDDADALSEADPIY